MSAVIYPDSTDHDASNCEHYVTVGIHYGKESSRSLMGTGRGNTDTAANESDVPVNTDPIICESKDLPC